MTPNYLKKMLPLLLDADPAQATNVRLVSLLSLIHISEPTRPY